MNEKIGFCAKIKCEYYVRNIKMLYNWSYMTEDEIYEYLQALGLFDYIGAIKWLLMHKSTLDAEINNVLNEISNGTQTKQEYTQSLDKLKVALIVCNKTQTSRIYVHVVECSENPKLDIRYLTTF